MMHELVCRGLKLCKSEGVAFSEGVKRCQSDCQGDTMAY